MFLFQAERGLQHRVNRNAHSFVGLRVFVFQVTGDCSDIRLRLRHGRAG